MQCLVQHVPFDPTLCQVLVPGAQSHTVSWFLSAQIFTFTNVLTQIRVNSLAALAKCDHLRVLDLSLVTESIPILDFFRVIEKLGTLQNLHLPRASLSPPKDGPGTRASAYPRNLKHLVIPGRISRILSAHAPESVLEIESLHLQEVPLDYWDLAFLNKVTVNLRELTIREPVSRSTGFEQGVWDTMLNHFVRLKSFRLEYFSNLYHLLSTIDPLEPEIPAAFESLQELVIGPIPAGADLLRSANRPFDINDLTEEEDTNLREFVDNLPQLRRLVLMAYGQPSLLLQDLLPEYLTLSTNLHEKEQGRSRHAQESGLDYDQQLAGVFWTLDGPSTQITDPKRSWKQLNSLDSSVETLWTG